MMGEKIWQEGKIFINGVEMGGFKRMHRTGHLRGTGRIALEDKFYKTLKKSIMKGCGQMSNSIKIELKSEDLDMIYKQLKVRVMYFEELMIQAAKKGDTERVIEIAEVIKTIQSIMNKLTGA